jgi:carbamoyl-phosphate synthase large subunit
MPLHGAFLFTVSDKEKEEASHLAKRLFDMGFRIWATEGTAKYFESKGIPPKLDIKFTKEMLI